MKQKKIIPVVAVLCILLLVTPVFAAPGDTTRVSVDSSGSQGDNSSKKPSISADGRYVVFESITSNLVAGDTNGVRDIFVRDTTSGTTNRVSVDSSGVQGNNSSSNPSISADGRYVAFESYSSNLVSGDTNGNSDVFVYDTTSGNTTRVSLDSSGVQGNGISYDASISADGRYVAFDSFSSNLVSGDTNGIYDIFVRDTTVGTTTRVSLDSSGVQGNNASTYPSISADGHYVAFESDASNLVSGDTNGVRDVFLRDTISGTTTRVSLDSSGVQGNGTSYDASISADGRYVAFDSFSNNLVSGDTNWTYDVFVRDTIMGTTTRVSLDSHGVQGNNASIFPSISADGRYVAFESDTSNLVSGDTNGERDVFVRDTTSGTTTRVSLDSSGVQGNNVSINPSISSDGRYVAFESTASNLVSGDTNGTWDIFVNEIDLTVPTVEFDALSVPPTNGATLTTAPSQLLVSFTQNVLADGSQHAANSLQNYMLLKPGINGSFDTMATAAAICDAAHTPTGDDVLISFNSITYNAANNTATLSIDPASAPLSVGSYRLYVCGESSIWNLRRIPLNSGANSTINFTVGSSTGTGGTTGSHNAISSIPATGFTPEKVTLLPMQTITYDDQGGLSLEIPSLGVTMPVTGVPRQGDSWDVTWLGEKAGWLEGTAFPSWKGNSVLTGHVWNADNTPGAFRHLDNLKWGDRIIIHYAGQRYTYEVRGVEQVKPGDVHAMLRHEETPWLTLVTCKGFDEKTDNYSERLLVRAALIEVK